MLNFAEQTGSGAVMLVWSFLPTHIAHLSKYSTTSYPTYDKHILDVQSYHPFLRHRFSISLYQTIPTTLVPQTCLPYISHLQWPNKTSLFSPSANPQTTSTNSFHSYYPYSQQKSSSFLPLPAVFHSLARKGQLANTSINTSPAWYVVVCVTSTFFARDHCTTTHGYVLWVCVSHFVVWFCIACHVLPVFIVSCMYLFILGYSSTEYRNICVGRMHPACVTSRLYEEE